MSTSSLRRSGGSRHAGGEPPYIVMVGQTGSGKSEIAKQLAHPEFVSSNSEGRGTPTSDLFWTFDETMVICDVPEDHPGYPIFEGNIPLALALTFEPISLILITVKAVNDIYTVLANIKTYCDGLSRVYYNLNQIFGFMITDMDEISAREWDLNELKSLIDKELTLRQVKCIITSKRDDFCDVGIGSNLMRTREIREMCGEKYKLPLSLVLSDRFLTKRWEKDAMWQFKLLVDEFKDMADQFSFIWHEEERNLAIKCAGVKKGDIMFEFRSWMKYRLFIANNKLADSQNFVFGDKTAGSERIYLYSMENQVKHFIFDLKLETKKYLVECDVDPRRCPYCNEIWTKDIINDCDGDATCGIEKISPLVDYNMRNFNKLGYYAFQWDSIASKLRIRPCSEFTSQKCIDTHPIKIGCGRSINWKEMPQVNLSKELMRAIKATFMTSTEPKKILKKVVLKPTVTTYPEKIKQEPPNAAVSFEPGKKDYFKRDPAIGVEKTSADQKDASKEPNSSKHEMKLDSEGHNFNAGGKKNYVVFIGDVGVGKSTVVEKLTGMKMDRGDSKLSVTRSSSAHWSYDGTVIVSDTPGSNSIEDQLQHNEEIAAAFNYRPISRVLVVVKADARIANVMRVVEKYSERLLSLPDENIGVLVTHMDTVSWNPRDLKQRLTDEYGIECVLFCGKDTPKENLIAKIRGVCGSTISFRVDDTNFSDLFKINDKMVKILKDTSKVIDVFTKMSEQFDQIAKKHNASSNPAFVRDFQSWLETQITEAEERFIASNKFTFDGKEAAKESGYIANLTNQIRVVFNNNALLNEMNYQISNNHHELEDQTYGTYIFTLKNGEINVMEWKAICASASVIPCKKSLESIKCTLPTKNDPLPPIPTYKNNDIETKCLKEAFSYGRTRVVVSNSNTASAKSPALKIERTKTHGPQKFSFFSEDGISAVDDDLSRLSISGTENVKSVDNKNLCRNYAKNKALGLEEFHPSHEKAQKIPPISFKINLDFSIFGQDIRSYTLQWKDDNLKIAPLPDAKDNASVQKKRSEYELDLERPQDVWGNMIVKLEPENTKKFSDKQETESRRVKKRGSSKSPLSNDGSDNEKLATRTKSTSSRNNKRQNIDAKPKSSIERIISHLKPKQSDEDKYNGNADSDKESKNISTEHIFNFEDDDFGAGRSLFSLTLTPTPRGRGNVEYFNTKTSSSLTVASNPRPSAKSKTLSNSSQPPTSRALKRPAFLRNITSLDNKAPKHTRL